MIMKNCKNRQKRNEFQEGLIWNYVSIAFLALGGFIFSFLIILFYDSDTLGIFNLVYAYYLVLSQISVFGIHMSVTRYISECNDDIYLCKRILSSAMYITLTVSVIFNICIGFVLYHIGILDIELKSALWTVLPALVFFSLNKVILGFLNGLSKMKAYAVFQSLRNVFISISILILALFQIKGYLISICFFIAELLLFIIAVLYLLKDSLLTVSASCEWIKKHVQFGFRILPANMVLELNTKIDVICLGMILQNDSLVGVYSFATLFTEGFYQIFVVIRRSINPQITQYFKRDSIDSSGTVWKKKIIRYLKICALPLEIALIGGFCLICFLLGKGEYYQGIVPLIIISMSIVVNSKGIVFGNILSQLGYPTQESIINCMTAASNFVLNVIFIRYWGLVGAATATAISYFIYTIMLRYYTKIKLNYIV